MRRAGIVALVAAMALLAGGSAVANAASPVLEFVAPSHGLPVGFTTEGGPMTAEMAGFSSVVQCAASHGDGEITGPRSAVAEYRFTGCATKGGSKCKSESAQEEEIVTGAVDADLVFLDQAKREVAMLLNPAGGTYMSFKCGGESVEGRGPFLAPVSPIGAAATTFTATLSQSGSVQTPDEYEGPYGERLKAVPEGRHGTSELVTTGVAATITVHTSVPVEIKTMSIAEVEAKQQEEEAAKQAEQKQHEEEALAKKRQEEEAAARKHQEEIVAAIKAQEEAAAAQKKREEEERKHKAKPLTRGQLLAKALRQCRKEPKRRRARCMARAHRKYGRKGEGKRHSHISHTLGQGRRQGQ